MERVRGEYESGGREKVEWEVESEEGRIERETGDLGTEMESRKWRGRIEKENGL